MKITILLITLVILLVGCSNSNTQSTCSQPTEDENCDSLIMENMELKSELEDKEYDYFPTGCENPLKTITMCKKERNCNYFWIGTPSMYPLLGDDIKLTFSKCNDYVVGDIIMFINKDMDIRLQVPSSNYIVHQIIDKKEDFFVTKGFNSNSVDKQEVKNFEIMGKVTVIEYY